MKQDYQIATVRDEMDTKELAELLAREGHVLLPMVELIEQGKAAVDDLIDTMGRASIEAVLLIGAAQIAGPRKRGKRDDSRAIHWYGRQGGRVALRERQLRVKKPRLRRKQPAPGEQAEVAIPVYEAMRHNGEMTERMLALMLRGVSTRNYAEVLPKMAEQVGISRSQVSRASIEAGEKLLKELAERDFSKHDILIVYIDGIQFAEYHVIAAVGVDVQGDKHVLGLREGATENSEVVKSLLEDLVQRGVAPAPGKRRLFVIDGAKALRKAIDQVYGKQNPVQRCRNHKKRNVLGHLPKDQHAQARATMAAAWKLDADEGIKKLEQYASWLERDWPSAAGSLREGLAEMFTVNRLGLPPSLCRCLTSTNLIDSTHSGVRGRTGRVTHWQSGSMALRWSAGAFDTTAQHYRKIMGHHQLWMLKAHLDAPTESEEVADPRRTG